MIAYLKRLASLAGDIERELEAKRKLSHKNLSAFDFDQLLKRAKMYKKNPDTESAKSHQALVKELQNQLGVYPDVNTVRALLLRNPKLKPLSEKIRPMPTGNDFDSFASAYVPSYSLSESTSEPKFRYDPNEFYGWHLHRALSEQTTSVNNHFGRLAEQAKELIPVDMEDAFINALTHVVAHKASLLTDYEQTDQDTVQESLQRTKRALGLAVGAKALSQYKKDINGIKSDIRKFCGNGVDKNVKVNAMTILNRIRKAKDQKDNTKLLRLIVDILGLALVGDKVKR